MIPGYGVTYDPEGMLSTLPAIAVVLIGILAGKWLRKEQPVERPELEWKLWALCSPLQDCLCRTCRSISESIRALSPSSVAASAC